MKREALKVKGKLNSSAFMNKKLKKYKFKQYMI